MEFKHYDDIDTFDRLYRKNLLGAGSNRQAYRKVERRFADRFGKRKYKSFESFKSAYYQRHAVKNGQ